MAPRPGRDMVGARHMRTPQDRRPEMPFQDLPSSILQYVMELWVAVGYAGGKAAFVVGFITSGVLLRVVDAQASAAAKIFIVTIVMATGLAFVGLIARWQGTVPDYAYSAIRG